MQHISVDPSEDELGEHRESLVAVYITLDDVGDENQHSFGDAFEESFRDWSKSVE